MLEESNNDGEQDLTAQSSTMYEVTINERSAATGVWDSILCRTEIVQMKGNFWRSYGYVLNKRNFLHPEESLLLLERGQVVIRESNSQRVVFCKFYEEIITMISLPCYLVYIKLQV